ncbi:SANT/Myb_domain [Hexamita inflata]|uniref:SANT/Myb domain n=1 Tax=Hexamita inflata TaxID=28002 RepID=A0AA86V1A0_9EUKA|nr:SANT/Myb domain [Hexamita inflata]
MPFRCCLNCLWPCDNQFRLYKLNLTFQQKARKSYFLFPELFCVTFCPTDYISKCKLESLCIFINTISALRDVSRLALVYTSHFKFMSPRVIQRWTEEEEEKFARLVLEFNRDFKLVARHFANRSYNQIRSHYYNGVHKTAQSEEDSVRQMAESPAPSPASTVKFMEEPELSAESPVDQSYFVLFTVFE